MKLQQGTLRKVELYKSTPSLVLLDVLVGGNVN